ncbi:LppU/SCO3897 family protein [Embleya hyalina]|uniref:LppU/SCO3897 family protein n=1 Tax=Embleya hyalina TaxID=516124 RepID=UPI000F817FF4|nr:hypothetical protein [Embleya hyalina]
MIAAALIVGGLGVTGWVVLADPDLDLWGHDPSDASEESPFDSSPPYGVPSAPPVGGSYTGPPFSPSPSRTPDPLDKAFAAVGTGDCVNVFIRGGEWNRKAPDVVACRAADAYMSVASTRDDATCEAGGGRTFWRHTNDDGSRVKLCLERQFRAGQCFPGTRSEDDTMRAQLSTLWDCDATTVPQGSTHVMKITGLLSAGSAVGSCPGDPGKRQRGWTAYNGLLVCAESM